MTKELGPLEQEIHPTYPKLIRGGSISHVPVVFLEGRVSDGDVVVAVPVGPDPVERRALLVLRQPRGEPE